MTLVAIWAEDKNGVIAVRGHDGLPWKCPEDLKHFKQETKGRVCIVGRATYEQLPKLRDRRFVVLSRRPGAYGKNDDNLLGVCHTPEAAFALAQAHDQNPYCIGGQETFRAMWPYVTHITRTKLRIVVTSESPLVAMGPIDLGQWEAFDDEQLSDTAYVEMFFKRELGAKVDQHVVVDVRPTKSDDDARFNLNLGIMKVDDLVTEEHRPILEDIAAGNLADLDEADSLYLTCLKDRYHHLLVQHRCLMDSDRGSDLEPQLRALEILIHCGD